MASKSRAGTHTKSTPVIRGVASFIVTETVTGRESHRSAPNGRAGNEHRAYSCAHGRLWVASFAGVTAGRPGARLRARGGLGSVARAILSRRRLMEQIIVAYDGTESAKRALERGADVAKAFDAKVIVTSVASLLHSGPRADQQFELHSAPTPGPEIQRDSLADHEAQLADATAFFAERG